MVLHAGGGTIRETWSPGLSGLSQWQAPWDRDEGRQKQADRATETAVTRNTREWWTGLAGERAFPRYVTRSPLGHEALHTPERLVVSGDVPEFVRLGSLIPHGRYVNTPGGVVFVCPYGLDEVRVLRNLGWEIDAPMLHEPGAFDAKYRPFIHQRAGAAFITMHSRGFILFEQGTGKTFTTLLGLRWLRKKGLVRSVLIVAPLSTLRDVWEREVFTVEPLAKVSVLHGSKKQRLEAWQRDADYYIINHDGVKLLEKELQNDERITCVVIDESTAFKNARTARWKAMNAIVNKGAVERRCYALTGTPAAQAPTDAWGQAKLVHPFTTPKSFVLFREMTMAQIGPHKWEPRPEAKERVLKVLRPFIHVRKQDCIDLPPMIHVIREAELTKEQQRLAEKLIKEWVADLGTGEQIAPANAAVKLAKLLQIYQGAVIAGDDGEARPLDCKPRHELVRELVEEASHGVICFVPYKGVLAHLRAYFEKEGVELVEITGDVTRKKRESRFEKFRSGEVKLLLAHPATVSHGLSFTNADTIIWYGPYFSVEGYLQANERIARPGQQNKMTVYHVAASSLEKQIYQRLSKKVAMHDELVDLFRAVTKGELS